MGTPQWLHWGWVPKTIASARGAYLTTMDIPRLSTLRPLADPIIAAFSFAKHAETILIAQKLTRQSMSLTYPHKMVIDLQGFY